MHYRASLEVIREYEVEQNQSASPILAQYVSGLLEDPPATIDIPPLDVEMSEPAAPLLYLSSSARPSEYTPSESTPSVLLDSPSATFSGSSCFDHILNCSSVIPRNDPYMRLSSHTDDLGSFAASCGFLDLSLSSHNHDDTIHIYDVLRSISSRSSSHSSHSSPSI